MFGIEKEVLDKLRVDYPAGTRIQLIEMSDPYTDLVAGDTGIVRGVDDIGTVHVDWDKGSSLGLVYGEDKYTKID